MDLITVPRVRTGASVSILAQKITGVNLNEAKCKVVS